MGEQSTLTANNDLTVPITLVFSNTAKLASISSHSGFDSYKGSPFENFFSDSTLFNNLISETAEIPKEIFFKPLNLSFPYTSHVMKDPSANPLALIIVLLPKVENTGNQIIDDKIIQMDRLAKAGQLASSIAHEIRNPLAGISANVQVLADIIPDKVSYEKFFTIILDEINRVERIIKDLLDYARPSKPVLAPVSLKNIMEHIQTLLNPQLTRQKVKLHAPDINQNITLLGDFSQIIQVLLNCIMNSAHAMPEGGSIQISHNEEHDSITLVIRDHGIGIKKEILDKIFEPFFTTRAKGLGLGLSVTKKIMDDHKGSIKIYSSEGQGTEVLLTFLNANNPVSQNQERELCQIQS